MGWFDSLMIQAGLRDPGVGAAVARPRAAGGFQSVDVSLLTTDQLADFLQGTSGSKSGRVIGERAAMQNSALNRAVVLTSSAIGSLPCNLFEKRRDGTISKADQHPVHRLLRTRPNAIHTPFEFKSYMQGRAMLYGNAYAFKVPGVNRIQALMPLDPRQVQMIQDENLNVVYRYIPSKGGERTFTTDQILHLRSPWSSDGLHGVGLLVLAADALGLADITEEAAAAFLKNGAQPGGALKHPKTLSATAIQNLREQFRDKFEGTENAGRWFVFEEGMDAVPFPSNGKDAQALEQRKYQAEEISRFTGVPRPLLMFDETSWGSGIEALGLFFVTYCLMPWFVAWEEAIARSLLTEAEQATHYAKFNEAALLRGSLKDQAEFFAKALGGPGAGGFMLPDEAREKMDMNPLPDGEGQSPAWTQGTAANVTA